MHTWWTSGYLNLFSTLFLMSVTTSLFSPAYVTSGLVTVQETQLNSTPSPFCATNSSDTYSYTLENGTTLFQSQDSLKWIVSDGENGPIKDDRQSSSKFGSYVYLGQMNPKSKVSSEVTFSVKLWTKAKSVCVHFNYATTSDMKHALQIYNINDPAQGPSDQDQAIGELRDLSTGSQWKESVMSVCLLGGAYLSFMSWQTSHNSTIAIANIDVTPLSRKCPTEGVSFAENKLTDSQRLGTAIHSFFNNTTGRFQSISTTSNHTRSQSTTSSIKTLTPSTGTLALTTTVKQTAVTDNKTPATEQTTLGHITITSEQTITTRASTDQGATDKTKNANEKDYTTNEPTEKITNKSTNNTKQSSINVTKTNVDKYLTPSAINKVTSITSSVGTFSTATGTGTISPANTKQITITTPSLLPIKSDASSQLTSVITQFSVPVTTTATGAISSIIAVAITSSDVTSARHTETSTTSYSQASTASTTDATPTSRPTTTTTTTSARFTQQTRTTETNSVEPSLTTQQSVSTSGQIITSETINVSETAQTANTNIPTETTVTSTQESATTAKQPIMSSTTLQNTTSSEENSVSDTGLSEGAKIATISILSLAGGAVLIVVSVCLLKKQRRHLHKGYLTDDVFVTSNVSIGDFPMHNIDLDD